MSWMVRSSLFACAALLAATAPARARGTAAKHKPFQGKARHDELGNWRDARRGGGLTISPNGRRCAYWRRAGVSKAAVIDGAQSAPYRATLSKGFVFSPDSKHVACAVNLDGRSCAVVLDGKPGPPFAHIVPQSLTFHPATGQVVYVAAPGAKYVVVVGEKAGTPQFRVNEGRVVFSADGKHMAWLRERKPDQLYTATMSVLVLDGKETGKEYFLAGGESLAMSPDGRRLAFSAKIGEAFPAVIDGKPEGTWSAVTRIVFSPDSRRCGYEAKDGMGYRFVVDGTPGPELRRLEAGSLQFSPDSKHVAGAGPTAKGTVVFLDGKPLALPQGRFHTPQGRLVFSGDSRRLAVAADMYRGSGVHVFETATGKEIGRGFGLGANPRGVAVGPDNRTVLWASAKAVGVNDRLVGQYDSVIYGSMGFDPDGSAWCIAVRDDKLVRVTATPPAAR